MILGITAGFLASLLWIGAHTGWMHIRPAHNRFKSMLAGYLVSLPLPGLICLGAGRLFSPGWTGDIAPMHLPLVLLHAYLWHLLLFFAFCEFFYLVERSVSLRLLVEVWRHPDGQARLAQVQSNYTVADMIRGRLAVLAENGFIEMRDGQWRLRPKARLMARAMRVSAWIYQSVGQADRL